jgi:hypothetical protein
LTEATPSHSAEESVGKSRSGSSKDSETASDDSGHLKVAVAVAAARITYDFGVSGITEAHIGSMEKYARYFPKGYGRAPGAESVPEPRKNEVVAFDDFLLLGFT